MIGSERFYVPNPNFIHDTLEGEVILLDLDTGVLVWNLLVAGVPLTEIQSRLEQRYPKEAAAIKVALEHFVQELQQEKLVALLRTDAPVPANPPVLEATTQTAPTFVAPVLLKYTDM